MGNMELSSTYGKPNIGINIGANFNDDSIEKLATYIIKVATCSPFESVNEKALDALMKVAKVENVSISNVNVDMPTIEIPSEEVPEGFIPPF